MAITSSPLRYPGGKSNLTPLVVEILRLNDMEHGHYAEPYAGGCGLALNLLYEGYVSDIHINDIDPAIWAFWDSILNNTAAFVDRVYSVPVTVDEWRAQREIFRKRRVSRLALGFAAFFLNRTNRSGVIKDAGVIGGLQQRGEYKIDCRFNREDLVRRILRIKKYRDRIHLTNLDALDFLRVCNARVGRNAFMFVDPPYFNKGSSLYTNFYRPNDHAALAGKLLADKRSWIVTYDNDCAIKTLYRDRRQYQFDIQYSLHEKRLGKELLIASKGLRMPSVVRRWLVHKPR